MLACWKQEVTLEPVLGSTCHRDQGTAVTVLSRNAPWTGYRRGALTGDGDRRS
ncbi:MAG: hypothetical protein ACFFD4_11070 [Candidatus Odinarchaeota archaeon]